MYAMLILLACVVICEPFSVGTAPDTLYRVAGASDDWARGGAGIKVTENIIPFENIVLAVDLAVRVAGRGVRLPVARLLHPAGGPAAVLHCTALCFIVQVGSSLLAGLRAMTAYSTAR